MSSIAESGLFRFKNFFLILILIINLLQPILNFWIKKLNKKLDSPAVLRQLGGLPEGLPVVGLPEELYLCGACN